MPFVKNNHTQGSQPLPSPATSLFIGRTNELLSFIQQILQPNDPKYNILSISGQGGVGKTTLLQHLIVETHKVPFVDYCLTAIVSESQANPVHIMEQFAQQLHISGTFEKTLKQYKETLRKQQAEQESLERAFFQSIPDLAGAVVEGIPVAGPFLREGTKVATSHLLGKSLASQGEQETKRLQIAVSDLTRTFVSELSNLTNKEVRLNSMQKKRFRRIVLFFDTFEQLTSEITPWLLGDFLKREISSNVVLVVSGRDPLERSSPKEWLPYENEICRIVLNSFTEEETRTYLLAKGITEEGRVATIWQLSCGLPLYLGLLTANPQGNIDPTKDVFENFLRWLPGQEHTKYQLSLDASLFSKPFNQDDLEAFEYIPKNERAILYRWLTNQTFVQRRSPDGRHLYHEIAQKLFNRHFYQISPKAYLNTRRNLIKYYQREIDIMQKEAGERVYESAEWLETVQALVYQLLFMPDETSHIRAIERVLLIHRYMNREQETGIIKLFHKLSQERSPSQATNHAQKIAKQLLLYIETHQPGQELISIDFLIETASRESSFSPILLAFLYRKRAWLYAMHGEEYKAITNYNQAIELAPKEWRTYADRGNTYRWLGEYERAMQDFNYALELNPRSTLAYSYRALTYLSYGSYEQAIQDCNYALDLDPKNGWAYICRSMIYRERGEYRRAMEDCNQALQIDPPSASRAYLQRGINYSKLKKYREAIQDFGQAIEEDSFYYLNYLHRAVTFEALKTYSQALQDLDRTLELNSRYEWAYCRRALVYLKINNVQQAFADYAYCWELNKKNMNAGWMAQWSKMCYEKASIQTADELYNIANIGSDNYLASICRGVAMWLQGKGEQSVAELEQAVIAKPRGWDASFWKGLVYAFLGQHEKAIASITRARELDMPPILLMPLRWLEQDNPDFYERDIMPLLEIHG